MTTKKCNRCLRMLDLVHFHADSRKRDGYYTICKDCRAGRTAAPVVPDGYRACRECNQIKCEDSFYSASDGYKRRKCIECCEARWNKSYRNKTHRIGNGPLTLFGYLPTNQKRVLYKRERSTDQKYRLSDRGQAKRAQWKQVNRAKFQRYDNQRRSIKAGLIADFSDSDWQRTLDIFGRQCAYCGAIDQGLAQDHWVPLSRGGAYTIGNIVPACKSCNSSKRNKAPEHFCSLVEYQRIVSILLQLSQRGV